MNAARKSDRLSIRATAEEKRTLEAAAKLQNCSVSEFILGSSIREAEKVLHLPAIKLTALDSLAFAEALLNPRDPSDDAVAAARHARTVLKGL